MNDQNTRVNEEQRVKDIMSTCNMPYTAICAFDFVKDNLINCRAVSRLPQNAKSIIMAIFPYKIQDAAPKNISRYAAVTDYHKICGEFLKKATEKLQKHYVNQRFEYFIDNSPIPEVAAAQHCGLGVLGKNGLLINKKFGSYVFLGEIVTDLELIPDKGGGKCLDCRQCTLACPVNLCKQDCLSSVNQQKKPLTDSQIQLIRQSGCVWGCDICSEVCPMNKNAEPTYINEFIESYRNEYIIGENTENRAYTWRGIEVINRNAELLK